MADSKADAKADANAAAVQDFKPVPEKKFDVWPPAQYPFFTSSVYTKPGGWSDSLPIPHETIRYLLLDFEHTLKAVKVDVPWHLTNVMRFYCEYYYEFVHHHHHIEEHIIFPFYAKKGAVMPPRITEDHKGLLKRLTAIRDLKPVITKHAGDVKALTEDLETLKTLTRELREHMFPHLTEEEQIIPAMVLKYSSEAEEKSLIESIMKAFSLETLSWNLAAIGSIMRKWGGQPELTKFLADIPGVFRARFPGWEAHYNTYIYGLLTDVLQNKQTPPYSGCFCCLCWC